jgi:hypothetical protein
MPGAAPHARQANPAGGWPWQFAHRVVSCRGDTEDGGEPLDFPGGETPLPAIAAAFGGATVEALCQPISSPSFGPESSPCAGAGYGCSHRQ